MSQTGQAQRDSAPGRADGRPRDDAGPSSWHHRLPVLVLALAGFTVAADLALVQLGLLGAWDPVFGDGTTRVLFSGLARSLPVPDAGLGAVAYALEAALVIPGGPARWATSPRWALGLGLLTLGMAVGGIVLVLVQALAIGSFCTLCLASAAISWGVAVLDLAEFRAAARHVRDGGRRASSSSDRDPSPSASHR